MGDRQMWIHMRHHVVHEFREGTGGLDAGRSGPDDDEVERSILDQIGLGRRVAEHLEHPRPNPFGVLQAVQGHGELFSAGGVEEVRLRSGRHYEHVALDRAAIGEPRRCRMRIHRDDLGRPHVDVAVPAEHLDQVEPDVVGRQFSGRDLIQQRQELVKPPTVDQRDMHPGFAGELLRASDAGEPTANDDNPGDPGRRIGR
jgi:hypothetical protein